MSSPSQGEANGATRNSYDKAGYLVKVEEHNGTDWQTQSEMRYDGLGNRLEMTSYNEGVGETIRYQLDNGQPLAVVGTESTSFYLYGRGVIGTKTDSWGYILQDSLGSTRQLATHEGVIAMSVAYTPWGDVLEYYGSGGIDFGYLGGIYDDATGLIYLGRGQYYDPVTGRFLTRGAGQSNPYKPGAFDPAGMMVAPLALIGLALGKKKKRGKWDTFIAVLFVCVVVGMSVSACSKPNDPDATPTSPTQPPAEDSTPTSDHNDGTMPTAQPPLEVIVLPDCDGELLRFLKQTPLPTLSMPPQIYVFTGYSDNFYSEGPSAEIQLPILDEMSVVQEFGLVYQNVKYGGIPGSASPGGKQGTANAQLILDANENNTAPKILYCFSAGNEACVMYAEKSLEKGVPILGIAFIGGSFEATENGDIVFPATWKDRIDKLYDDNKVSIMVVNDNQSAILYRKEEIEVKRSDKIFLNYSVWLYEDEVLADHTAYTNYNEELMDAFDDTNRPLAMIVQQKVFKFTHDVIKIWYP